MIKLIATAEAQGFGPASQLLSILRPFLKNIDFFGTGTCYEYLKNNGLNVKELDLIKDYEICSKLLSQYDILITVMDSRAALLAKYIGLKVVYIDLIFSLFNIKESFNYYKHISGLIIKDESKLRKLIEHNKNNYNRDFMNQRAKRSIFSHILSDKNFSIEFLPCTKKNNCFLKKTNCVFTEPILDQNIFELEKSAFENNKLVVSLGGMQKQNNYSNLIRQVLFKLNVDFKKLNLLNQKNYFKQIQNSKIILCTPGFSIVYELLFLNKILLILPAQNAGQIKFVDYLKQNLSKEQFISWEDFFEIKHDLWAYMNHVENEMNTSKELSSKISSKILEQYNKINDDELKDKIIKKQKSFLKRINLSNGKDIQKELQKLIQ